MGKRRAIHHVQIRRTERSGFFSMKCLISGISAGRMTRTGEFLALPILSVSSPTGNSSLSQLIEAQAHAHTHAHTHTLLHSHKKTHKKSQTSSGYSSPSSLLHHLLQEKKKEEQHTAQLRGFNLAEHFGISNCIEQDTHLYTIYKNKSVYTQYITV